MLSAYHKISHALSLNAETAITKDPESNLLADLGEPPGKTGGNWDSLWGHRPWQQPFLETHSNTRILVLARTILESSL